jgi:hypothetical protein
LVAVFSYPDDPFRVHENFQAVDIFKHDELHVASSMMALGAINAGCVLAVLSIPWWYVPNTAPVENCGKNHQNASDDNNWRED